MLEPLDPANIPKHSSKANLPGDLGIFSWNQLWGGGRIGGEILLSCNKEVVE